MGREVQFKAYTAEDAIPRIQSEEFRAQLKRSLEFLIQKLTKVELHGANRSYSYYTCGQDHNPNNRNWKPFKNLEAFCKKEKIYMPAFLGAIEDLIGHTFDCECEMLTDKKEAVRVRLALTFGVDFDEKKGGRDCDVI